MDTSEIWRPVVGFEGRYSVSSHGRVRSEKAGLIMRAKAGGKRYPRVNLYRGSRVPYACLVHRLVAEAFLGPCPPGKEVNHLDCHRGNPELSNLEYVTHAQNLKYAHDMGMAKPALAAENGKAKLTVAAVRKLRAAALAKRPTVQALAAEFGISERHALHIMQGERWQHLPYLPSEPVRPRRFYRRVKRTA